MPSERYARLYITCAPSPSSAARCGGHVGLAHQALADQEGVHAGLATPVSALLAIPLGDDDGHGTPGCQPFIAQRGGEGLEVAVVDAHEVGPGRQHEGRFAASCSSTHPDIPRPRDPAKRAESRRVVEDLGDQEHGVGAHAGLDHLVFVDQEILAAGGQTTDARMRARYDRCPWK